MIKILCIPHFTYENHRFSPSNSLAHVHSPLIANRCSRVSIFPSSLSHQALFSLWRGQNLENNLGKFLLDYTELSMLCAATTASSIFTWQPSGEGEKNKWIRGGKLQTATWQLSADGHWWFIIFSCEVPCLSLCQILVGTVPIFRLNLVFLWIWISRRLYTCYQRVTKLPHKPPRG